MKKSLFSEKRMNEKTMEHYQRQKRKWECIRRNKLYIQDFTKYGNRELNEDERNLMFDTWGVFVWQDLRLPDPDKPIPDAVEEYLYYPLPNYPHIKTKFFADLGHEVSGLIFPPGQVVKERGRIGKSQAWVKGKLEDWAMFDKRSGRYMKLTMENCPRYISTLIEIQPWFKKAMVEGQFTKAFESAFQRVRDAQKAILKRQPRPHFDEDDFRRFLTVYDLRTQSPPLSMAEIAIKLFPKEISSSVAYKKKPKRQVVPLPSAMDKVKYYWREAKELIDGGGWRYL